MSAPLVLDSEQLRTLAEAIDRLSAIRQELGVDLDPYSALHIGIGDSRIRLRWDDAAEAYAIDDRNGD